MFPALIRIDDGSRVAEARRAAETAAHEEGLDESEIGAAAIIASEAASNLEKYAKNGELLISRTSGHERPGVEILSLDRGPGIADLDRCFADGYSTSATSGGGLGAMRRLSQEFDAYSQPGKGTVLVARVRSKAFVKEEQAAFYFRAVCVPMRGEEACGDAWCVRETSGHTVLMVADGLGHGVFAADAAKAAVAAFERSESHQPAELIDLIHRALRGTRGAAIAVASIDRSTRRIRYAGLGNISGVLLGGVKAQYMLSHNGTAGHDAPRVQEFEYSAPQGGLIVMHSDGLTSSWTLDAYPGLLRQDPSLISAILYRDANRGRDDVCVAVAGV